MLDTSQNAIFTNVGYQFHRRFSVYAGLNGNPGTRSLQGNHPLWLGTVPRDGRRVLPALLRFGHLGSGRGSNPDSGTTRCSSNTNSILDVKSSQLDCKWTTGASTWWMPTTEEFGPKGAYGDWEAHDDVATRFGVLVDA